VIDLASYYLGSDAWVDAALDYLVYDTFDWFMPLPLLVQALLILFIFDFGQYWMHRAMHNWYPLWLPHSVHHYITQLNINKGAVGNPVELFLIGLGIGGFFDFLPRAFLLSGAIGMAISSYDHINVRFNSPGWWRFLFNTTEHHSLHHSQDYEATRSNFAGTFIFIDRMFGTCIDGEAELLGMEGGRRMSIREQMIYPFSEGWKAIRGRLDPSGNWPALGGGSRVMGNAPQA
jgi:sterol desaturase/sphingolipid hydroxylase (fatty acid hydroxylase superfamily)